MYSQDGIRLQGVFPLENDVTPKTVARAIRKKLGFVNSSYVSGLLVAARRGYPFCRQVLEELGYKNGLERLSDDMVLDLLWLISRTDAQPCKDTLCKARLTDPARKSKHAPMLRKLDPRIALMAKHLFTSCCNKLEPPFLTLVRNYDPDNIIWNVLIYTHHDNVYQIADKIGMLLPQNIRDEEDDDYVFDPLKYFYQRLETFIPVLKRPKDYMKPPELLGFSRAETLQLLEIYSDKELIHWYELYNFNERDEFEYLIWLHSNSKHWDVNRYRFPVNGETLDLVNLEPHKNLRYEHSRCERGMPLRINGAYHITYGYSRHYRIWTVDELIDCVIKDDAGDYMMRVPDGDVQGVEDKLELETYFTRKQIKGLYAMVTHFSNHGSIEMRLLSEKLSLVLHQNSRSEQLTRILKSHYQALAPEMKTQIQHYIGFLTMLVPYIRFWKGPEHPIQYEWIGDKFTDPSKHGNFNSVDERDLAITQEKIWRQGYLTGMATESLAFIRQLPLAKYEAGSYRLTLVEEQIDIQQITIEHQLDRMFNNELCIAQTSDLLYQSVPYYFHLMGVDPAEAVKAYTLMRYQTPLEIDITKFDFSRNIQDEVIYENQASSGGHRASAIRAMILRHLGSSV